MPLQAEVPPALHKDYPSNRYALCRFRTGPINLSLDGSGLTGNHARRDFRSTCVAWEIIEQQRENPALGRLTWIRLYLAAGEANVSEKRQVANPTPPNLHRSLYQVSKECIGRCADQQNYESPSEKSPDRLPILAMQCPVSLLRRTWRQFRCYARSLIRVRRIQLSNTQWLCHENRRE